MEEREIIKGMTKKSSKFKKIFTIIFVVLLIVILIWTINDSIEHKEWFCEECEHLCEWIDTGYCHDWPCSSCRMSVAELWFDDILYYLIYLSIPTVIYIIVMLIIKFVWDVMEINVTNKRVYGKTTFGKRVDLPLDSISSIGKIKLFKGIKVATSSGKISFSFIDNNESVYEAISKLLVDRQNSANASQKNNDNDYIKELKSLKELLDAGVITQEEYDTKKKEILSK